MIGIGESQGQVKKLMGKLINVEYNDRHTCVMGQVKKLMGK